VAKAQDAYTVRNSPGAAQAAELPVAYLIASQTPGMSAVQFQRQLTLLTQIGDASVDSLPEPMPALLGTPEKKAQLKTVGLFVYGGAGGI